VIFGKKGHAEVIGLEGQTNNTAIVIEGLKDLDKVDMERPIYLFSQTTKSVEEFHAIVDKIKAIRRLGEEARIYISAKNGNIEVLRQQLIAFAEEQCNMQNAVTISNTRHYEALVRAGEAIKRVQEGLQMQISGEFLSMDLQDCLAALGEITGQITSQEVLNNIFGKFCIGK
jgi:tRNA U34 5-carboxymethylaminomethyl modifying GTPase MnmE/TrmE